MSESKVGKGPRRRNPALGTPQKGPRLKDLTEGTPKEERDHTGERRDEDTESAWQPCTHTGSDHPMHVSTVHVSVWTWSGEAEGRAVHTDEVGGSRIDFRVIFHGIITAVTCTLPLEHDPRAEITLCPQQRPRRGKLPRTAISLCACKERRRRRRRRRHTDLHTCARAPETPRSGEDFGVSGVNMMQQILCKLRLRSDIRYATFAWQSGMATAHGEGAWDPHRSMQSAAGNATREQLFP